MTRVWPYLLSLLVVSACSSTSSSGSPAPAPSTASPTATAGGELTQIAAVTGDRFSPSAVTVHVGDSVKVVSTDAAKGHDFVGPGFNSGNLDQGQSFTTTFSKAGTFAFVCTYHEKQGMTGTITVEP